MKKFNKFFGDLRKSFATRLILIFVSVLFMMSLPQTISISIAKAYTDKVIEKIIKEKGSVKIGFVVDIKSSEFSLEEKKELTDEMADKIQEAFLKSIPLSDRDKIILVERSNLNIILEEHKLSASGLTDDETTKIGKVAGLDIIIRMIFHRDSIALKSLKVDTGATLDIETQPLPRIVPPTPVILANHTFTVSAFSNNRSYEWNLRKGTTLKISFKSNLDINAWFLSHDNFLKFESGQSFRYYPNASGERLYNSDFEILISETGTYHFVLDNSFSVLTPKTVTVYATIIEP